MGSSKITLKPLLMQQVYGGIFIGANQKLSLLPEPTLLLVFVARICRVEVRHLWEGSTNIVLASCAVGALKILETV